jgi:hypothetical protein
MNQSRQRFPWLALLIGLILGAAGGWAYAWFLNPVILVNITPQQLVSEDQREYIVLVSEAYLQDYDLDRARARLNTLSIRGDIAQVVADLADRAMLNGADLRETRALATLAEALGANPRAAEVFSGTAQPTSALQTPTTTATFEGMPTITPTLENPTLSPTPITPTATNTPDFDIETELQLVYGGAGQTICDTEYPAGMIEIWVQDALGRGIPGVRIQVEWEGHEETLFTGLMPDIDPGYADYQMEEPNTRYTVTLVSLAEPVLGLESTPCPGLNQLPTFQLVFEPAPPTLRNRIPLCFTNFCVCIITCNTLCDTPLKVLV